MQTPTSKPDLMSRDEIAAVKEKIRLLREKNGYDKHGRKIRKTI